MSNEDKRLSDNGVNKTPSKVDKREERFDEEVKDEEELDSELENDLVTLHCPNNFKLERAVKSSSESTKGSSK